MMRLKLSMPKNSHGVALISVLLMLAIMVTLISYMVESQFLSIRQANLQQVAELSLFENSQTEHWSKSQLIKNGAEQAYELDHLGEPWANESFEVSGDIDKSAFLSDLQSRFNLNNLSGTQQATWQPIFESLLEILEIDKAIADTIVDWVDENQSISTIDGAEDSYYESLVPPRLAANQSLATIEELLLVKGVTEEIYQTLLPYVSVLEEDNVKVNVNTASEQLLEAIRKSPQNASGGSVSNVSATQFVGDREAQPFISVEDVIASDFFAGVTSLNEIIDIKSQYFEMESSIKINDLEKHFRTGFKREVETDSILLTVIYRKRLI